MKRFFYFLGNIVTIIVSFFIYSLIQLLYFYPFKLQRKYHLDSKLFIAITILFTIIGILIVYGMYRRQLKSENDWGFNRKPHWDWHRLLLSFIGAILLVLVSIVVQAALGLSTKTTSANQSALDALARQAGDFYKPMIVLIAPIFEETIFRGMVFNTFFAKETPLNRWVGIVFSGFLFAVLHDSGFTKYIFVYWALGCVLAWIYTQTKDLRYSIIAHMLYNSLGFL